MKRLLRNTRSWKYTSHFYSWLSVRARDDRSWNSARNLSSFSLVSFCVILFTGYFCMGTRNVTFFGDFLIFILARKWWYFNIFWKDLVKRKISTNHSSLKSKDDIVAYICSRHYLYYSIYLCKVFHRYEKWKRIKWFFFDFSNAEFCSTDERLMASYDNADIHKIHRPSVRCNFCTWLIKNNRYGL